MIIAGWAGIGKTTLAKKYKNVIDIESSPYKWDYTNVDTSNLEKLKGTKDRVPNKNFPDNYIKAIKDAEGKYDVICVWYHPEQINHEYDKNGINYFICFPNKEAVLDYEDRMRGRGNNEEFVKGVMTSYYIRYDQMKNDPHQKIELEKGETLESRLLKMGVKLIKK